MDEPAASVVIPAFNAARFVGRAVASALDGQGLEPVEVVAVDDASTDGTGEALRALAAGEPRLRVLSNPRNLGPGGSRDAGIAAAHGRWVALLDADDAFAPGRLGRLVAVAEAEGAEAVADLPVLFDLAAGAPAPVQLPASGRVARLGVADLLRPHEATGLDLGLLKPVFRRSLAERGLWRYGEGALRHGEDFALYLGLLKAGVPFVLLEEARYLFSTRVGGVTGRPSPGSVTAVDYPGIAAHARALARAEPDAGLARLLEERAERVERLNRIHGWTLLRKGEARRLLAWLRRDPVNRTALRAVLGAKLRGRRGRPE